jgi:8-oxo-dGTP diphosphatase
MTTLQVAVGVIKNPSGQILISFRDSKLHQGGLWEFPGGKIEASETVEQALARELMEELDISVHSATPLITINHQYPDLAVQLIVYSVEKFSGTVKSCEGQPFLWVAPDDLVNYKFPSANQPIITAARLPAYYAVLDDADPALLLDNFIKILKKGVKLIHARLKNVSMETTAIFLAQARPLCQAHEAILLLNSAVSYTERPIIDGIHLTSTDLLACDRRPDAYQWVAASCHTLEELHHAQKIGVDFVVLAPVLPTPTHPEAHVLGWPGFAELVASTNLPVYALGGMALSDLPTVQRLGGQGISAIRAFLE